MSRFSVRRVQRLLVIGPVAVLLLNCCAGALAKKLGNSTIHCWSNSMKFLSVFVLSLVVLTLNVAAVLDGNTSSKILQAGLDYLKQPGRKLATIGFSMGGQESLNANLNDPQAVSASVIIYGFGFDKIDTRQLEKLKSTVLVIAGS